MKEISEMTEDELRDYALSLRQENEGLKQKETEYQAKEAELTELNKTLQKRNNDLFMKVSQPPQDPKPKQKEVDPPTESVEDFARNLVKEGKI